MAVRPPDISDRLRADHGAVREAMAAGVSAGYAQMQSSHWTVWEGFCAGIGLDPKLQNVSDPIPFLQMFAHRVRRGELAIRGKGV